VKMLDDGETIIMKLNFEDNDYDDVDDNEK
jgi:hypothetical protein